MSKIKICAIGESMIEITNIQGSKFVQSFAGDTLNFLSYLNKKNISADYLTAVGGSKINKDFFYLLKSRSISNKFIHVDNKNETGLYLIKNDNKGEKSFYYWRDNSAAKIHLNKLNYNKISVALKKYDYLYFSGITLSVISNKKQNELLYAIKKIKNHNVKIIFDLNVRVKRWLSKKTLTNSMNLFLPYIDILFCSGEDIKNWKNNQSLEFFKKFVKFYNIKHAIFRQNASKNYVFLNNSLYQIMNKTKKKIIDSSGAGDGYNAAYISEYLISNDVYRSLKSAHFLGSKIVMKKGAIV